MLRRLPSNLSKMFCAFPLHLYRSVWVSELDFACQVSRFISLNALSFEYLLIKRVITFFTLTHIVLIICSEMSYECFDVLYFNIALF